MNRMDATHMRPGRSAVFGRLLAVFLLYMLSGCRERDTGPTPPVAPSALPLPNAPPGAVGAYAKSGLTPRSEGLSADVVGDAGADGTEKSALSPAPDGGVHL